MKNRVWISRGFGFREGLVFGIVMAGMSSLE